MAKARCYLPRLKRRLPNLPLKEPENVGHQRHPFPSASALTSKPPEWKPRNFVQRHTRI